MNKYTSNILKTTSLLTAVCLLAACASTPKLDPRIDALEASYNRLISDQRLYTRGGEELTRAERALKTVQKRPKDMDSAAYDYAIYATDRLIQLAEYSARSRLAEDQREMLIKQQNQLILESRTQEAERAKLIADRARISAAEALAIKEQALAEANEAQKLRDMAQQAQVLAQQKQLIAEESAKNALSAAQQARAEAQAETARANAARAEAEAAQAEMKNLRNQLAELEAKQTERGLLITLGDVLFEFNKSELKNGAARNLMPLAKALQERPEQTVIVEGHTDSIGSKAYNLQLSERRAESVQNYLVEQGIDPARISVQGMGPDFPLASNTNDAGRQKNRRVEVILPNLVTPEEE